MLKRESLRSCLGTVKASEAKPNQSTFLFHSRQRSYVRVRIETSKGLCAPFCYAMGSFFVKSGHVSSNLFPNSSIVYALCFRESIAAVVVCVL